MNKQDKEKAVEISGHYLQIVDCFAKKHYDEDDILSTARDAALEMAQWKDEQVKQLHKIIIKLWDMLDWIDTYADLKIDGSENDVYFSKIENKTKERFDFVKSDGYDLFINDEKITNNEHNTAKTD